MKCKYHPSREATKFCTNCGIPLCNDCVEEAISEKYYCFQCAMIDSVSEVGTSLVDKHKKSSQKKLATRKKWGPFHFFVIISSVLILVMGGVVFFGGPKESGRKIDFVKDQRVFLFMVDSCVKRYAHYKGNKYPEKLSDLVPDYLPMKKYDLHHLQRLSYQRDNMVGYRLSLANPNPGEMLITMTSKGIQYIAPSSGGA